MRRPSTSSAPRSAVPRQIFASSPPAQSPFVSGGRVYGGCGSAPTSVIEPVGVVLADPLGGGVGGHAAADDQVSTGRAHVASFPSK